MTNNYNGLRIAGINYESMVDGDGVRAAIYFSGCSHHCPECHNPHTWNPEYGTPITDELISQIAGEISKRESFLTGITFTGGDPFFNPFGFKDFYRDLICEILIYGAEKIASAPVWFYTGYTLEQLGDKINLRNFTSTGDVIVDGRFVPELADRTLKFRGSSNQKIYTCIDFHDNRQVWWCNDTKETEIVQVLPPLYVYKSDFKEKS